MDETTRFFFIRDRDGEAAALKFIEQTLSVYVEESIHLGPYKTAIRELVYLLDDSGLQVQFTVVEKAAQ